MRRLRFVPDGGGTQARFCSQCGKAVVVANAAFCKDCGAPLQAASSYIVRDLTWRPLIAAGLSIIPGLGHLYKRHPWQALAWFVGVVLAYHTQQVLGFILQMVCAGNAALAGAIREEAVFARLRRGRGSSPYRGTPRGSC